MKYPFAYIPFFVWLIGIVVADVEILTPENGDTYSGSSGSASIKVSWNDPDSSDSILSLNNAKAYTLSLCTNGSPIQCQDPAIKRLNPDSRSTILKVNQNDVPDGYYFIQVYTEFKSGDVTIRYTPRFKLEDMKGSAGTLVVTVDGAAPSDQISASGQASEDTSASFTIPYTLQSGLRRYAPMQMQPGTKVTATTWTRAFPTSAVTFYSTKGPKPNALVTTTPPWSYSYSSEVNWASVAPYPTNWYPASQRKLSKAKFTGT